MCVVTLYILRNAFFFFGFCFNVVKIFTQPNLTFYKEEMQCTVLVVFMCMKRVILDEPKMFHLLRVLHIKVVTKS